MSKIKKKINPNEGVKHICIKECFISARWLGVDEYNCSVGEVLILTEHIRTIGEQVFYLLDGTLAGIWSIYGLEEYFIPVAEYRDNRINEILND